MPAFFHSQKDKQSASTATASMSTPPKPPKPPKSPKPSQPSRSSQASDPYKLTRQVARDHRGDIPGENWDPLHTRKPDPEPKRKPGSTEDGHSSSDPWDIFEEDWSGTRSRGTVPDNDEYLDRWVAQQQRLLPLHQDEDYRRRYLQGEAGEMSGAGAEAEAEARIWVSYGPAEEGEEQLSPSRVQGMYAVYEIVRDDDYGVYPDVRPFPNEADVGEGEVQEIEDVAEIEGEAAGREQEQAQAQAQAHEQEIAQEHAACPPQRNPTARSVTSATRSYWRDDRAREQWQRTLVSELVRAKHERLDATQGPVLRHARGVLRAESVERWVRLRELAVTQKVYRVRRAVKELEEIKKKVQERRRKEKEEKEKEKEKEKGKGKEKEKEKETEKGKGKAKANKRA
ncbi:hypothetical protein F4811DRAFT_572739 [Daldinia bambusicola]|nr:hypothetical protein F4811DRAFT_572739 [Daldinia bambusicola]